jgi:hypothetical protein
MPARPTREQLLEATAKLAELAGNPTLLGELKSLEAVPEDRRLREAERRLDPEALRNRGVPLPEHTRIALRYFENPETRIVSAVGVGSLEGLRKPNIVQEIAGNPRLFAELSRTHPEVLNELARVRGLGSSVCVSVGFIACLSIGSSDDEYRLDG